MLHPLAVGLSERDLVLDFGIRNDAALNGVDQQHLPRLHTPLAADAAFRDQEHAHFGRENDGVVIRFDITRRAETVTVKRRADLHAVREDDRGGAVPGFHHRGVVGVERLSVGVHRTGLFPGFGDQHHHGLRERVAAHHEDFEGVIEARRVALTFVDQRGEFLHVVPQHRRLPGRLSRPDPVVFPFSVLISPLWAI